MNNIEEDTLEKRINIDNYYSNFMKLLKLAARLQAMYQKMPGTTFKNLTEVLAPEDITNAERFFVLEKVTVEYIQWEEVVSDGWK